MTENMETLKFDQYPGAVYLSRDTVETLHHVMGIKVSPGARAA